MAFGSAADIAGEPWSQFLGSTLLGGINSWFQNQNRPDTPQPFTRNQESIARRGGIDLGAPGGGRVRPGNLNLADIMQTFMGDERRTADAQRAYNERLQGAIGDTRTATGTGYQGIEGALGDLDTAEQYGADAFNRARTGLNQAVAGATQDAKTAIRGVMDLLKGTVNMFNQYREDMKELSGDVMAAYKEQTAKRMGDAAIGIGRAVADAASATMAQARAAGIPEGQAQTMGRQTLLAGSEGQYNTLLKISAEERSRHTELLKTTGGWQAQLTNTAGAVIGEVAKMVGGEIGSTMRNLSTLRGNMATINAGLEENAAQWRGSIAGMRGQLRSFQATLLMQGQEHISNLTLAMEEPLILMGDIMEGIFALNLGLENYEHQLNMERFGGEAATMDQFIQSMNASLGRLGAENVSRHEQGVAQNQASQDRVVASVSAAGDLVSGVVGGIAMGG